MSIQTSESTNPQDAFVQQAIQSEEESKRKEEEKKALTNFIVDLGEDTSFAKKLNHAFRTFINKQQEPVNGQIKTRDWESKHNLTDNPAYIWNIKSASVKVISLIVGIVFSLMFLSLAVMGMPLLALVGAAVMVGILGGSNYYINKRLSPANDTSPWYNNQRALLAEADLDGGITKLRNGNSECKTTDSIAIAHYIKQLESLKEKMQNQYRPSQELQTMLSEASTIAAQAEKLLRQNKQLDTEITNINQLKPHVKAKIHEKFADLEKNLDGKKLSYAEAQAQLSEIKKELPSSIETSSATQSHKNMTQAARNKNLGRNFEISGQNTSEIISEPHHGPSPNR